MIFRPSLAFAACLLLATSATAVPAVQHQEHETEATRIARWQQLGYGMFVHWGLYSELGGVWQGKPVSKGYSEQIQGWANIPSDDYLKVAARFAAPKFDADAICKLAKDGGARYIVVTSKHHDGFAMFDTKSTDYNIVKQTPFGKDPLKLLSTACRRIGVGFGVYFSLVDWHAGHAPEVQHNSNPIPPAMEPLIEQQLTELMSNYGPIREVWFDMSAPTAEQSRRFAAIVRKLQPQAAINGRIWNNRGDFVTLGDNELPPATMQPPFEVPASIYHATWGYRSWQQRDDLQGKIRELATGLVQTRAAGGNYLLNIGPMGDGSVVPFEADVLHGIGAWLQRYPGLLDARPSGLPRQPWGATLLRGNTLYLAVHEWHAGALRISGLANDPIAVRVDGGDAALHWHRDGNDVVIELPAATPDVLLPVLRVTLSTPLRAIPANIATANGDGVYRLGKNDWRTSTSYTFGSGYLTQAESRVSLAANIASPRPQRVALRFIAAHARNDRIYHITIAGRALDIAGSELATRALDPFVLPASPATNIDIRLAHSAYPAEDLGLSFDALELRPVAGTPR
ncbi:alpha-L-fucosidase [Solilutibacter silvestris]|uniref:alpha-L-fucosidase n=1 Tax=Solilutibacter silvestris TaxID=1645665 RepID=A0A2K1Q0Z7_9GAMM|nr:alpha-L-fucosidase [Lysobacter silvestris]PNS08718.1 Alpha-L-fucosidase [Lysobacter silvestris]